MMQIHTKVTSQGQVSVPAAFRTLLGITPGSTLEWTQEGDHVVVRRAGRHGTAEVHQALFPEAGSVGPVKTLDELKQGIREHVKRRHAGG